METSHRPAVSFAPELQLRDVVWSDESFFRLRSPTTRTRGSVGVSHVSQFFFFSQFFACARCCHEFHGSHRECRTLLVNAFLSLSRMRLSRSNSKIDAFGDDETARCSRKSAMLGCAGLRLALPPRKAFLNIDLETSMCAAQRRSAKHFINYATDTSWHSPQTPTAPQRQTTRGKTCFFVTDP